MDHNPKTITQDLIALDPRFKKRTAEVESALSSLLKFRPHTEMRSEFLSSLRSQLISTGVVLPSAAISENLTRRKSVVSPFSFVRSSFQSRSSILVALIAFLIITPLTYVVTQKTVDTVDLKDVTSSLSQKQQITMKPGNAFGTLPLAKVAVADQADTQTVNQSALKAKTALTAPSMMATMATSTPVEASSSNSINSNTRMAMTAKTVSIPEFNYYYAGKPLTLEAQGAVLKRTTGTDARSAMLATLKNFHFDLTNLSSFTTLPSGTLTLQENKSLGYNIMVNADQGSISIVRNPEQWKSATSASSTTALSLKDAVSLSTEFFSVHGISLENYGQPVIQAATGTQLSILYPLIINKRQVYEEDGSQAGITVIIDTQVKKVIEVRNIISQLFESSDYTLENDPVKVLASINATSTPTAIPNAISLKEPKLIYVRTVLPDDTSSSELYLPTLRFMTATSSVHKMSETLTVPLVKNLSQSSLISSTTTQA